MKIEIFSFMKFEEAYNDYCKALKKHGFKTVKGFIKDFFTTEFVLPTSITSLATTHIDPTLTPLD